MLGIIIGALWYVFAVLIGGAGAEVTVLTIANFLWYWYLVWGIIIVCIPLCITMFGLVVGAAGTFSGEGGTALGGAAIGLVGTVLGILTAMSTTLYLTAVWLLYHAGNSQNDPYWNVQYLIGAGVCAGLAVLLGLSTKAGSSSSNN